MLSFYQGEISVRYPAGSIFIEGGESICLVHCYFMLLMQS